MNIEKYEASPVISLKIELICEAVDRWTELWETKGKHYSLMTLEETREFNADLNVLACNTMNNLAFIRKNSNRSR